MDTVDTCHHYYSNSRLYLLDLGPCDFFLYQKMKDNIKGHHLISAKGLQEESSCVLKAIIPMEDFSERFHAYKTGMIKYITVGEKYFEGNLIAKGSDYINSFGTWPNLIVMSVEGYSNFFL